MADTNRVEGVVVSCDGNGFFSVKIDGCDNPVLCRIAGKMQIHKIKIVEGDKVEIDVDLASLEKDNSPRGRITFRKRN
jgi:translation initiation factor IF-1